MLRTILVGLDGSESGHSALKLAIRWSRRYDALLVGMGCVDEPGIHGPEEIIAGEGYFADLNSALLEETRTQVEGRFHRRRSDVPRRALPSSRWR